MPLVDQRYVDEVLSDRPAPALAARRSPLLARAALLKPDEKLLVEMVYRNHLSHRQIGQLLKIPAGTVSRRLARICARLRDPLVLALIDGAGALPEDTRALAIAHFLHRTPVTELARAQGRSEREISGLLDYVRGWHRGLTHAHRQVHLRA